MAKEAVKQINDAIGSHALWLSKLQQAIRTGATDVSAHLACHPGSCTFGKWLDSDWFTPRQKATFAFRAVRELHKEFHQLARDAISAIKRGDILNSEHKTARDFLKAGDKFVIALRLWKRDIRTRGL